MLMLDQVTVRYGDQVALDLQSKIQIADGDIVGIIGRNGAGKSTLIKALTDQVAYTGQIDKPADIAVHLQENHYPDTVTCQTILEGLLQTTYRRDQKLQALVAFFEFAPLLKRKFTKSSRHSLVKSLELCIFAYASRVSPEEHPPSSNASSPDRSTSTPMKSTHVSRTGRT